VGFLKTRLQLPASLAGIFKSRGYGKNAQRGRDDWRADLPTFRSGLVDLELRWWKRFRKNADKVKDRVSI
jgi:hypothetical protein